MLRVLLVLALLLFSAPCFACGDHTPKASLKHFVSLKFKEGMSEKQMQEVVDSFKALKSSIPQIVSIEGGPDVSPGDRSKGFTYVFLVTFANSQDLNIYQNHPEHKKVKTAAMPAIADMFVFDYNSDSNATCN